MAHPTTGAKGLVLGLLLTRALQAAPTPPAPVAPPPASAPAPTAPLPAAPPPPAAAPAPPPPAAASAPPPPAAASAPSAPPPAGSAPAVAPGRASSARVSVPPDYVYVRLDSSLSKLRFALSFEEDGEALQICEGWCEGYVPRGEYWLTAAATDESVGGQRRFDVTSDSDVFITPRTHARRNLGLAMGIGGPIVAFAGMITFVASVLSSFDEAPRKSGQVGAILGGGMFFGGIAITPIGWVLFAQRSPAVDVNPLVLR